MKTSKDFQPQQVSSLPKSSDPLLAGLKPLGVLAAAHWKENRPALYQNLREAGQLRKSLEAAQDRTYLALAKEKEKLLDQGWEPAQAAKAAWDLVKEEWVLLPSEEDQPELNRNPLEQPEPEITE